MKRLRIALLGLVLVTSACAPLPAIDNPVTPTMLAGVENSAIVIAAGLSSYRKACVAQVIPQDCRGVVASIQVYTRQLPPLLKDLRGFVRNNDQVNAIVAYRAVTAIVSDVVKIADANNIKVQ